MAHKTYGIDFGTGTVKVYKKSEGILLNEKNIVATVGKGADVRPIAIGDQAYEMFEKVPPNIHVSFPMENGVIAQMGDMVSLWNFMMGKISPKKKIKNPDFYLSVPADIREVDQNAYSKVVFQGECKPHKVFLIRKPIADAFGLGLDIETAQGIMIVNIGADTTEISVLSLGGIVVSKLLPYGGNYFDGQIIQYIRKEHNFVIGQKSAEQIKKSLVSAVPVDETVTVVGRNVLKGLPEEVTVSSAEIFPLVHGVFYTISAAVRSMLERTPPEIASEIGERGIYLTGGSSWLRGMDQLVANETRYKVNTTKHAQRTVINGLGYLTEHPKLAVKYSIPLEEKK
jgi:rod shape-determining protein MreB